MTVPSERVLDLFAVPGATTPLGSGVVAGDLLLVPGRDPVVHDWLSPLLARLAVTMDSRPARRPLDLRLAVPVPARDGSWVVDGWAASRHEPGTVATRDLDVTLAAGRVLHAELASWVPTRPAQLAGDEGQLVHTELFGNVLLDGYGAPVVVDVRPAWLPVQVAEGLCVLDAVAAGEAPDSVLARWDVDAARDYRRVNPR
ncbi:MAG TPA: aminoglycoside phosphotransferase [Nocardioides bacterium]|uniref:hypothetical protein n=1 Tax=uncultured Nocardioides sp. TaxID=198441 RepID=UPI000EBAA53E|nr:hypothetical protein [uncultured Nocardioides sp.]HCB03668.1 aminoglycoside phosphotransferase [Nocardioides sp.]